MAVSITGPAREFTSMTSNNQPPGGVPTLDKIAADPACAASLPRDAVLALLAQCSLAQSTLFGHLLASLDNGHPPSSAKEDQDRLLSPEEAATRLGVTQRWLYRHASQLPFTRRLSRKVLRFSETGLQRWQANRRRP